MKTKEFLKYYKNYLMQDKTVDLSCNIYKLSLYDKLTNYEFVKLKNKIKNNKKFKLIYYSKELDKALKLNLDYSEAGKLVEYKILNDDLIDNLIINYSRCSSEDVVVEYIFNFKDKDLTLYKIRNYAIKYPKNIKYIFDIKNYFGFPLKLEEVKFLDNYLMSYLQNFIKNHYYSKYARKHILPNIKFYLYNEKENYKIKDIVVDSNDNQYNFYNENKNIALLNKLNYTGIIEIFSTDYVEISPLFTLSQLRTEGYLTFFIRLEKYEVENILQKYLSSFVVWPRYKDIKWLMKRIRLIEETMLLSKDIKWLEPLGYSCYFNNHKILNKDVFNPFSYCKKYLPIYEKYYEYLSNFSSIRNTQLTFIFTVVSIIIALIALIINFSN